MDSFYQQRDSKHFISSQQPYQNFNSPLFQTFPYFYAFPPFFPMNHFLGMSNHSQIVQQQAYAHEYYHNQPQLPIPNTQEDKKILGKIHKYQGVNLIKEPMKKGKGKKISNKKSKARYFDPNVAPTLTSPWHNFVEYPRKDIQARDSLENMAHSQLKQQQFPEEDSNPFIIFKNRKMKKKYRRFIPKKMNQKQNQSSSESSLSENRIIHGFQANSDPNQDNVQDSPQKQSEFNNRQQINQAIPVEPIQVEVKFHEENQQDFDRVSMKKNRGTLITPFESN